MMGAGLGRRVPDIGSRACGERGDWQEKHVDSE